MDQELNIDDIDERFIVRGRMEILDILNDLVYRGEAIRLSFNDGADSLTATLLEARDKSLVFEIQGDSDTRRRLTASMACSFHAAPDGIRIQFRTEQAKALSWDGSDAFSVPLPQQLVRLQRQESLRILVPPAQKLKARLFDGDGAALGEYPVRDLSAGGLGIAVRAHPQPELVQKIARVQTMLPGHGEIDCAVTLRHATWLSGVGAEPPSRIGMAFTGLPPAMRALIQRYILDTAQRQPDRGFDGEDDNA